MENKGNKGLRAIFIIFWIVGSIFWVLIGALDGDFIRSVKHIAIGWGIIFAYLTYKEIMQRKRSVETE